MKKNEKGTKTNILLVKFPPWDLGFPPLGIAYLSTYMETKGIDVKILDLNLEIYKNAAPDAKKAWENNDYFYWQTDKLTDEFEGIISLMVDRILEFDTTVIGFSLTISSRKLFNVVIDRLKTKAPEKIVVVGGPVTAWWEFRNSLTDNKDLIDYFVVGEGEMPIYHIMKHVNSGGKVNDMHLTDGFSIWKDNPSDYSTCIQGPRILKLDEIPHPTYHGFDVDSYLNERAISILGSRGCIRTCNFCNDTVMWGKPFRSRSPENVAEEIKYCVLKYNKIIFKFSDLILNGSKAFVNRISELLIKEDLKGYWRNSYHDIEWHGQIAVRKDMDLSLLKKMQKSGFKVANIGVESFSNNVLKLMNKGYTSDDAVRFLRLQKEAGIEVQINIILGFPGETEEDFNETLDCLHKAAPYIDYVSSISTCGVGPGSALYTNSQKFDIDITDSFMWYSKSVRNDIYIRMERYKRMLDFLKEEDIPTLNVSELNSMELLIKEKEGKKMVKG